MIKQSWNTIWLQSPVYCKQTFTFEQIEGWQGIMLVPNSDCYIAWEDNISCDLNLYNPSCSAGDSITLVMEAGNNYYSVDMDTLVGEWAASNV